MAPARVALARVVALAGAYPRRRYRTLAGVRVCTSGAPAGGNAARPGCACTSGGARGIGRPEVIVGELVTLDEAAVRVDRSRDTIRRWLRAGRLTRYEGTAPARGGTPPVLVDVDELGALVVELGLEAEPPRRSAPDVDRGASHAAELAAVRALADARVALAEAAGRAAVAEAEARLAREALADARADRDAWRDRAAALEAELAAARSLAGGTAWWRRLLPG